jgi:beta-xylosidase
VNYVISADKIEGPWSDPVKLNIPMIDPGHIVDQIGNRYLYFSSGSYVPLSKDGVSVIGKPVHSYDGWKIPEDWSIELFALEGPKLMKHGEYFYLTVAEGGTAGPATGHMVISARSKSPFGPWENSPFNPILRAKSKNEKFASVGHGTIFDAGNGDWYMIFHGYENGYYNMGRQTMLVPVEWTKEGWFKISERIKIDGKIKRPVLPEIDRELFTLSDNFEGKSLNSQWHFFNEYDTTRFQISRNSLTIRAEGSSPKNSSPLLCVPSDHSYTASVELAINGNAIGGLLLFYNYDFYSGILANSKDILINMRGWQFTGVKNVLSGHVFLRLKNMQNIVDIFYSTDGKIWTKVETSFDVSGYHHNVLSGFKSLRIGLCSIGEGSVIFKNFRYSRL